MLGINLLYCPLCRGKELPSIQQSLTDYHEDKKRCYLHCRLCDLVMVPKQYHLTAEAEKLQYDLHQNDATDPRYQNFLSRAYLPLFAKLGKNAVGLDFGCGPGPLLSKLGKDSGFEISNYDLYYYPHPELLNRSYDFVIMTEVIEHLADPYTVLQLLDSLLKPNAILAIMTKRVLGLKEFTKWHYKNDPTHLCFYSIQSFQWIARCFNWRLDVIDQDVVFFYKQC